jgi:hypothetical protein
MQEKSMKYLLIQRKFSPFLNSQKSDRLFPFKKIKKNAIAV